MARWPDDDGDDASAGTKVPVPVPMSVPMPMPMPASTDAPAVETEADDWDRWRMDSSDALRRRSWLLDEWWPGVWLRIMGGTGFGGGGADEEPKVSLGIGLTAPALLDARILSSRLLLSSPLREAAGVAVRVMTELGSSGKVGVWILWDRITLR